MKFRIVSSSEIASHPFHSLLPTDYLGPPEYVKELLGRFTRNDRVRLRWMLANGIVLPEQLRTWAAEKQAEILERPLKAVRKIGQNLSSILG